MLVAYITKCAIHPVEIKDIIIIIIIEKLEDTKEQTKQWPKEKGQIMIY